MKIYAIKTPTGFFISMKPSGYIYSGDEKILSNYFFDGVKAEPTFHPTWGVIKSQPMKVSHMEKQPNINHRYHLIDESLKSEKFPLEMIREDVAEYINYSWEMKDEYSHLSSLYKMIYDVQPDIEIVDEFEFIIVLETGEIEEPKKMKYEAWITQYTSDGLKNITNKDIVHQLIDQIVFPSILIHETPCTLSSKESYDIVRRHVQNNIDPKVAKITSDYDFCFTVQKRVPLAEPYKYQVDLNNSIFNKRKRKPNIVTRIQEERLLPCFEMTYSPQNYKGYTPIKPFEAQNENELKEQIDEYLSELMSKINEPLKECPTCCGVGFLYKGLQEEK